VKLVYLVPTFQNRLAEPSPRATTAGRGDSAPPRRTAHRGRPLQRPAVRGRPGAAHPVVCPDQVIYVSTSRRPSPPGFGSASACARGDPALARDRRQGVDLHTNTLAQALSSSTSPAATSSASSAHPGPLPSTPRGNARSAGPHFRRASVGRGPKRDVHLVDGPPGLDAERLNEQCVARGWRSFPGSSSSPPTVRVGHPAHELTAATAKPSPAPLPSSRMRLRSNWPRPRLGQRRLDGKAAARTRVRATATRTHAARLNAAKRRRAG